MIILVILVVVLGAAFLFRQTIVEQLSPRPENLGVSSGQLAPCPSTPNCVSTYATDDEHRMEPIPYTVPTDEARQRIVTILENMERATVVENQPNYVHAETRSPTMGFIDDVEFYFDEENNVIQFRSAARLGQSDMGANRERMEDIRQQFTNQA
jgi:uncharacterized protein (DUF1499 family)